MLTDSERFAFETRRHHAFASTGNAYDATQCDEAILTGDTLIVLAEVACALHVTAADFLHAADLARRLGFPIDPQLMPLLDLPAG
ncbi:MAG: hypothetical protein C0409_13805 [Novosphingobium sp.]|jgi:hypothetical protein|nr:hypothetical protein [Novosphingobium sp.]